MITYRLATLLHHLWGNHADCYACIRHARLISCHCLLMDYESYAHVVKDTEEDHGSFFEFMDSGLKCDEKNI